MCVFEAHLNESFKQTLFHRSSTRDLSSPSLHLMRTAGTSCSCDEVLGSVDELPAVVSDPSHCSLDERVGMVIGCSDWYPPVSQGTRSSLELRPQTGDPNGTFNKMFLWFFSVTPLQHVARQEKVRENIQ